MSLSHGLIDEKLAAAYIDTGPEMVRWLEANTPAVFQVVQGFPDYHPEHPGAKPRAGARWSARCSRSTSSASGRTKVTVGPQMGAQHHDERDAAGSRGTRRVCRRRSWSGARSTTSAAPGRGSSGAC